MKLIAILLAIFFNVLEIENRMLPIYYEREAPGTEKDIVTADINELENPNEKVIPKSFDEADSDEDGPKYEKETIQEKIKKPCAIVVLSNIQNPSMRSLLRKYRYDANGILIPNSVKYFIKLPQGLKNPSILVPLNDKAFSPLGGFVRYYKEVPPIPHACQKWDMIRSKPKPKPIWMDARNPEKT